MSIIENMSKRKKKMILDTPQFLGQKLEAPQSKLTIYFQNCKLIYILSVCSLNVLSLDETFTLISLKFTFAIGKSKFSNWILEFI